MKRLLLTPVIALALLAVSCGGAKQPSGPTLTEAQRVEQDGWAYAPADTFAWIRIDTDRLAQSQLGKDLGRWLAQAINNPEAAQTLGKNIDQVDVLRVAVGADELGRARVSSIFIDGPVDTDALRAVFEPNNVHAVGPRRTVIAPRALFDGLKTEGVAVPAQRDGLSSAAIAASIVGEHNGGRWLARTLGWGASSLQPRTVDNWFEGLELRGDLTDAFRVQSTARFADPRHASSLATTLDNLRSRYRFFFRLAGLSHLLDAIDLGHNGGVLTGRVQLSKADIADLLARLDPDALLSQSPK